MKPSRIILLGAFALILGLMVSPVLSASPDPDTPVISSLKLDPANPRVGAPYKIMFKIDSLKAPAKMVILEWIKTYPKFETTGRTEMTKLDKAIIKNKFTYAMTKGFFSVWSKSSKFKITAQLIDEKDRKSEVIEYNFDVD